MFGRDSRRELFFGPKEPRLLAAPWFLLANARAACDTIGGKLVIDGRGMFIRLCVRLGALGQGSSYRLARLGVRFYMWSDFSYPGAL